MKRERARTPRGPAALVADVHYQDAGASELLGRALYEAYLAERAGPSVPVFLLVGANSSTGDAVGPFVGWFLRRKGFGGPWLGDLSDPVHAANIGERVKEVWERAAPYGREPFLVAVDAAVGRAGQVTVNRGPLRPGAGMGKALPPVGHVHVMAGVATVPFGIWFAELDRTVGMAEVIADAAIVFWSLYRGSDDLQPAAGQPGPVRDEPALGRRPAVCPLAAPAMARSTLPGWGRLRSGVGYAPRPYGF
ncbi:DUF1256 domain-containing protein [Caldinitratiruptor microaerophilus]|uniref:Sporulation protein YyaC n=1 Tax=Caldinitratiruptor microaerophilus TaxID=671077 RepID=A0AA35GAH0_9FIRM|nr:DUF1256 domain-containing protein [Caldinitratiruptor microaerophilus]BDG61294.1 hypothetical protein caldi_23840 [Caldinitratiruptor microaerophilus]